VKKVLSIALALGLALTMGLATVPAGAVTEGTVNVIVVDCSDLAGGEGTYVIFFHNDGLLLGGEDHIDVLFPTGTVLPDQEFLPTTIYKGATASAALPFPNTPAPTALNVTGNRVSDKTVRFALDEGFMVDKCEWVAIVMTATNPPSCDYHLQVGTSVAGPYTSNDYRIYTAKVQLVEGKNLISLPAYPADPSIEVVLATLFAEAADDEDFEFSVWHWDSWEQEWYQYAHDTSFDSLQEMHAGRAYWVKVSDDITFKFKGDPYPECQGPPIKMCYPESWAMIGPAIQELSVMASEYLFDATLAWPHQNTYAVSTIIGFNPDTQTFVNTGWRPGQRDDLPNWELPFQDVALEQMKGYFMSFTGEACIIPPIPVVPDDNNNNND